MQDVETHFFITAQTNEWQTDWKYRVATILRLIFFNVFLTPKIKMFIPTWVSDDGEQAFPSAFPKVHYSLRRRIYTIIFKLYVAATCFEPCIYRFINLITKILGNISIYWFLHSNKLVIMNTLDIPLAYGWPNEDSFTTFDCSSSKGCTCLVYPQ